MTTETHGVVDVGGGTADGHPAATAAGEGFDGVLRTRRILRGCIRLRPTNVTGRSPVARRTVFGGVVSRRLTARRAVLDGVPGDGGVAGTAAVRPSRPRTRETPIPTDSDRIRGTTGGCRSTGDRPVPGAGTDIDAPTHDRTDRDDAGATFHD